MKKLLMLLLSLFLLLLDWINFIRNAMAQGFRVEIGQWDEGKEIGQTNKKTDRQTDFSEF